jgi:hypothetical protein
MVGLLKRSILGLLTAVLLCALGGAAPAFGASPWWHLSFEGRPASVQPGVAEDAVQEFTVALGERYQFKSKQLINESGEHEKFNEPGEEPPYTTMEGHAGSDQEMREALETMWGHGTVEVTGGPENEGKYLVKWIGARADLPVEGMLLDNRAGLDKVIAEGRSDGEIVVNAMNLGETTVDAASAAVTLADKLPTGLKAVHTEAYVWGSNREPLLNDCVEPAGPCTDTNSVGQYSGLEMIIYVNANSGAKSGEVNEASVSGGGIPAVARREPMRMSDTPPPFGVENYELDAEEQGGALDTQAGSHPFQLTTTISLNQGSNPAKTPAGLVKDLSFQIPPGLIGNPTPFAQCSNVAFTHSAGCPLDTVVGVTIVKVLLNVFGPEIRLMVTPLFNLEPGYGEPARFGFKDLGVETYLDTAVRTGSDYGVTVNVHNISQEIDLLSSQVTFWGVPGDPRHGGPKVKTPPPLLSLPTSCTGPLRSNVSADSWAQPGAFVDVPTKEAMQALDGCNKLPFSPQISVSPDEGTGSTPSGLNVDIHVPQALVTDGTALAESNVKNTTVALPEGVILNASSADGLQACSDAQIGFTGVNPTSGVDEFTPGAPSCPEQAKIATVKIKTPLLPEALEGDVYLASPQNFAGSLENPFGSLVAMYIVAEDPKAGVLVKLPGKVVPNPLTGQLISTFEDTPQFPFEELELHFFGGERAPLATPGLCGSYTTTASITPWSENPPSEPSSSFGILSGPELQTASGPQTVACSNPLPFNPTLESGTTNINAAGFSTLDTTLSREDGQQNLSSVQLHYPNGVSGLLNGVALCPEAQANAGTCGPESEIGETTVSVGLGGDPFTVTGGKVYITEKYGGAPFGLSIVNPAKAGPFVLQEGKPVVVRAKVEVNPITAGLTVTTDPPGSAHSIPSIIEGIPLEIKHVNVTVNRLGFTFNPTNCTPSKITGTVDSTQGTSSPVSIPFQVTNCASLKFEPKFAVSTSGKTSRNNGASLHVNLSYPPGAIGKDANIGKIKVDLPRQLPSRLTTLQKACTSAQFEANPAGCPTDSRVGQAKAITPLIPVPLEGPAYFVSYGGAKFPELVMVLQGYGVTLDVHGETYISKAGITSSTFNTVPDAPVGSFELTLPEGPDSALAANGNLCKSKLAMPTAFVGQNGAEIHESTPIEVTGCKPSVNIVRDSVKGANVAIAASVPSAGKLVASGPGLSRVAKSTGKAGTLNFSLKLSGREQALLKGHPGRKLAVAVKLLFTPAHGQKLTAGVTVNVG